jgi:hypothetical protein
MTRDVKREFAGETGSGSLPQSLHPHLTGNPEKDYDKE